VDGCVFALHPLPTLLPVVTLPSPLVTKEIYSVGHMRSVHIAHLVLNFYPSLSRILLFLLIMGPLHLLAHSRPPLIGSHPRHFSPLGSTSAPLVPRRLLSHLRLPPYVPVCAEADPPSSTPGRSAGSPSRRLCLTGPPIFFSQPFHSHPSCPFLTPTATIPFLFMSFFLRRGRSMFRCRYSPVGHPHKVNFGGQLATLLAPLSHPPPK